MFERFSPNAEQETAGEPMYEYRHVRGHIEVFLDGEFQFSADNMHEAREEIKDREEE